MHIPESDMGNLSDDDSLVSDDDNFWAPTGKVLKNASEAKLIDVLSNSHDNDSGGDSDDALTQFESYPVFQQNLNPRPASNYESLDYEICENALYLRDHKFREAHFAARKDFARWILFILIGVLTALVAAFADIIIEEISELKYGFLKKSVDENVLNGDLLIPYLYYLLTNAIPVMIGAMLVTFIEPIAAGSGVPLVKCYLNGVKVPRVVRIKTLVVKVIGVVTSVVGGLAGGKEGPMIQAGAVIAAGISQGKSTTFKKDFGVLRYFRDDHEKRDFVVAGASAGVSAAFGAPIGGVLFSLEEAASFWNPNLILRTLVASIISSFTLNVVLSAYHGMKSFSYPGLFNFGQFEALPYEYYEIPIFVAMGICGGILGALWNAMNTRINIFRSKFIRNRYAKTLEAVLVAGVTATFACFMMYTISDCRPLGIDPTSYPVQLFCEDNEYNAGIALWFQTPEATVKAIFHDPPGSHRDITLLVFALIYFPISCLTYGLSVSLGIFIPSLLVGAVWGRLVSSMLLRWNPALTFVHPSKYALIGAAAHIGGIMRMTISLTAILIETTGNISFALPLMITLITAKWSGDLFNEGIYDTQIAISKVPMLPWRVKRSIRGLRASDIMSKEPICVRLHEKVGYIVDILQKCSHNGFPVVDAPEGTNRVNGRLCGLILRSQLIVILKRKYFEECKRHWEDRVSIEDFRSEYPRYPSIDKVKIKPEKLNHHINADIFMNPAPHSAWQDTTVLKIFERFRALGLRHFVLVDKENHVTGIITRKDFL